MRPRRVVPAGGIAVGFRVTAGLTLLALVMAGCGGPDRPRAGVGAGPNSETVALEETATTGAETTTTGAATPTAGTGTSRSGAPSPVASGARTTSALTASDRGVTKDSVLLAWLAMDQATMAEGSAMGLTVPTYATEDYLAPYVKEINAGGGINGRKLNVKVVTYTPLQEDNMQAACVAVAEDLKAFGAVALAGFYGDAEVCLANKQVPTLSFNASSEDLLFRREKGWIRETVMNKDRTVKNWVDWMLGSGIATPSSRIGVFWADLPEDQGVAKNVFLPYLKSRGLNVAQTFIFSSDYSRVALDSNSAVLRFKSSNVNLVLPLANYFYNTFFLNQADSQNFRPKYAASDFAQVAVDATSGAYSANQWDRTRALTSLRTGEIAAGKPMASAQKQCLDAYQRNGGKTLQNNTDRDYALFVCEHVWLWAKVARLAGRNLTRVGFLAALDSIGTHDERVALTDLLTYRKGKYDGADRYAVVEWRKECKCYHQVEGFRRGTW